MTERGLFITLEGPEGRGKSTHARRLAEQLRAAGHATVEVRDPGGTALGNAIRSLLQDGVAGESMAAESELFLFMASRAQLVKQVIAPALARGEWVICDRFADSTCAYQGYGRGLSLEVILAANAAATGGLEPDLTVLLDVDVEEGFRRLRRRNSLLGARRDRIERETPEFHERVRAGYLELARRWPRRIRIVDALGEETVVQQRIWDAVSHGKGG